MTLRLKGENSGDVSLKAPATAGDNTITLPTSNGSAEQFLKNSGTAGELEFSSMVETSTGIGIGTSAPTHELHISGSGDTRGLITSGGSGDAVMMFENASGNTWGHGLDLSSGNYAIAYNSSGDPSLTGDGKVYIDTSGRLGLGTASPVQKMQVEGSGSQYIVVASTNSDNTGVLFGDSDIDSGYVLYANSDNSLRIGANTSERMRITNSGKLLLGCTSATGGTSEGDFVVEFAGNSDNAIKTRDTDNTGTVNHMIFVSGSAAVGSITGTTGAASFNNLSDYRRKENDVEIADGIEKVKLLRPIRFNYISDPNTVCDGFFAHEVTPAVPTAVTGAKDAVDSEGEIDPQMLDVSKLVPLLTAALQEAISKLETLETTVAALEAA